MHPVDRFPDVWSSLSWTSFTSDQQTAFASYFFPASATNISKAATILRLNSLCSSNVTLLATKSDYTPNLTKVLSALDTARTRPSAKDYKKHLEYLIAFILRILFHVIQPGHKEDQPNLVQLLKLAFDHREIPIVQLDSANYLRSIASVPVSSSQHQKPILRGISTLFSEIVSSRYFVVRLFSLRSFEVFAKTTPHSDLVASCVRADDQPMVASFVKRNPSKKPVEDLVFFFQSQSAVLSSLSLNLSNILSKLIVETSENINDGQMPAKRPRLEEENDEKLVSLIKNFDKIVTEIGYNTPIPFWAKEEIREQVQRLNSFLY